jgi:formylglycine-generating enzyme required for sulfatase activity
LQPNELGLFDMGGNVWEWCWDFHAESYPAGNQTNPIGPASGLYRLLRGGCSISPADQCTPVFRNTIWPTYVTKDIGFRVSRSIPSLTETVSTPVFSQVAGVYSNPIFVAISSSTPGATIRYTTDGTEPTANSGTIYTTPISVSQDTVLKAIAYRSGFSASSIVSAAYTVTGSLPPGFVLVGGGTFHNGTSNVNLSDFYLESKEVTQASYSAVMGTDPPTGFGTGDEYPVYYVTWFNTVEYSNRRSIADGLDPVYSYNNGTAYGTNPANWPAGWNQVDANQNYISANWTANGYRLPSEMEWMFAARGGNISMGYAYCGSNDINAVSWYITNAGNTTHPTAQFVHNELGLFDMGGNVWEWCWDYLADNYPSGDQTNPTGPTTGQYRILRGGSAFSPDIHCTSVYRNSIWPTFNNHTLGFRVARSISN